MAHRNSVLVTGGSGFIGSALVRRLVSEGHGVTLLASPWFDASRLADLAGSFRVFRDPDAAVAYADPDVVYHLAGTPFQPASRRAAEHYDGTVTPTVALLDAVSRRRGVRFVFTGSCAEYGDGERLSEEAQTVPGTVLGAAKLAASSAVLHWARWHGMEAVVLRLFTPYGPGERPTRLIPHAIRSISESGEAALSGGGSQQRDWVYIDDVVEALALAGRRPVESPLVVNVCGGVGIAVCDAVREVARAMDTEVTIASSGPARPDEIVRMSGDNRRAAEALGWRPCVSFEEGVARAVAWWREHPLELERTEDLRRAAESVLAWDKTSRPAERTHEWLQSKRR